MAPIIIFIYHVHPSILSLEGNGGWWNCWYYVEVQVMGLCVRSLGGMGCVNGGICEVQHIQIRCIIYQASNIVDTCFFFISSLACVVLSGGYTNFAFHQVNSSSSSSHALRHFLLFVVVPSVFTFLRSVSCYHHHLLLRVYSTSLVWYSDCSVGVCSFDTQ